MWTVIRDIHTFEAVRGFEPLSYELAVDSIDNGESTLSLLGELPRSLAGNWLVTGERVWLISQLSPKNGATTLKLLPPVSAFSRSVFYRGPYATVGAAMADAIRSNFAECPDPEYRLPYLVVSDSDTTPFIPPILSQGGLWSVSDYAAAVRQSYGVELSFRVSGNGLSLIIARREPQINNLVFNDGHAQLVSADFGTGELVKVSVWQGDSEHVYYKQPDGSVSASPPSPRLTGGWGFEVADEEDDAAAILALATDTLRSAKADYKIVLYCDREFRCYDRLRMRLYGEVVEGYVSTVARSSGDSRVRITAGELPTTLSEKLRKNAEKLAAAEQSTQQAPTPVVVEKVTRTQTLNWLDTWRYVSQNREWNTNRVWKYERGFEGYSTLVGGTADGTSTILLPLTGLHCQGTSDSLQLSMKVSCPENSSVHNFGWAVTTARHDSSYEGVGDLQSADMIGHGTYTVETTKSTVWKSLTLPCAIPTDTDLFVYLFGTKTTKNDHHIYDNITASLVDAIERSPNA